jgi:hypothetical protein
MKVPPCEKYGPNHELYTRKGKSLCRVKRGTAANKIHQKLNMILELLKQRPVVAVSMRPGIPPPPPPPMIKRASPKKPTVGNLARASMMNNLKKKLAKLKKN